MKQLLLMIEIFRGLIKNVQLLMLEKNEMHKKLRKKEIPKYLIKVKATKTNPENIYLLKFSNRNIRKRCEKCSKLTIKTPECRQ